MAFINIKRLSCVPPKKGVRPGESAGDLIGPRRLIIFPGNILSIDERDFHSETEPSRPANNSHDSQGKYQEHNWSEYGRYYWVTL